MIGQAFTFALRETRNSLVDKRAMVLLVGVGALIGVSGPFNTYEALRTIPRLAYWLGIVVSTFVIGHFVMSFALIALHDKVRGHLVRAGIAGVAMGPLIFFAVALINLFALDIWFDDVRDGLSMLSTVTLIAVVIAVLFAIIDQQEPTASSSPKDARLLRRLPLEKRGALISLSVNDHYVNVSTTTGREMLLMRLSDAIEETYGVEGLQVHRSHWVSLEHVKSVARDKDRAQITLSDGQVIPVSRSYMPSIRKAGLLA